MNTVLVVLFVLVILLFIAGVCKTVYEKVYVVSKNTVASNIVIDDVEILEVDDEGTDLYDSEII